MNPTPASRAPAHAIFVLAFTLHLGAADNARTPDHDYDAPKPGTYTLPIIKSAADGALLDSAGNPIRLAELTQGRITVMSFIYTRCAAARACPYATGVLMQLLGKRRRCDLGKTDWSA
jgi:cytochrome oxidase Cu insertion factor (SCO1/SenC/PrrC family)